MIFFLFNNKFLRAILVCGLVLMFWGMVHFRYHTWFDIVAGVAFTLLFQGLYFWILSKLSKSKEYLLHGAMLVVSLLFIVFTYYRAWVPSHMWFSVYGLSMLVFFEVLFQNKYCRHL